MDKVDKKALSENCLNQYLELIHRTMGVTISPTRKPMLVGRISSRMRKVGYDNFQKYLKFVTNDDEERQNFINLIATNETYFYRTPKIWEYLENVELPEFYKRNPNQTFKVWSAASSTGDEAYTTAVICEALGRKILFLNIRYMQLIFQLRF